MIERVLEGFPFSSRRLLAPFHIGPVISLVVLLLEALRELPRFVEDAFTATESGGSLGVLTLIGLTPTGSLVVIFSGCENFASKIDAEEHKDRPE